MRRILFIVSALLFGFVLGGGSGIWVLGQGQLIGGYQVNGWLGNRLTGSTAADPYTRAIVAKVGILALNREETIYFTRYNDDAGERFREGCSYKITGEALPARWWSITIYAQDDFLPVNGEDADSLEGASLASSPSGRFEAEVSLARSGATHWMSSKNAGAFVLGIRMYNPSPSAIENVATIPLPQVRNVGCKGAAS